MSTPYVGEIRIFAGNFAPYGWALCNGQLMSIAQETTLYTLIGTTYGGDGVNTFALPDLQGRVPLGQGQGPGLTNRNIGEKSGTESVTLTTNQMPAHVHAFNATTAAATTNAPSGNFFAVPDFSGKIYLDNTLSPSEVTINLPSDTVSSAGGSQPHENRVPSLTLTYIICLAGIFPSQN